MRKWVLAETLGFRRMKAADWVLAPLVDKDEQVLYALAIDD